MQTKIDPWLYPGCPCELYGGNHLSLVYFYEYDINGNPTYKKYPGYEWIIHNDNYKPINTPWDFAPGQAAQIRITFDRQCHFENAKNELCFLPGFYGLPQYPCIILWYACHLPPGVYQRPEWAKKE